MQRTTRMMFAFFMAHNRALDVLWMQKRRRLILDGGFSYTAIKPYYLYSDDPAEIIARRQDYPSPLFDRARKHQCKPRQGLNP